jgi:hypothetical protein
METILQLHFFRISCRLQLNLLEYHVKMDIVQGWHAPCFQNRSEAVSGAENQVLLVEDEASLRCSLENYLE